METHRENARPGTKVLAIKRKPTPPGVDPRQGEVIEVIDLGENVLTKMGRHVMGALLAGPGPAQLPAGNTYLQSDGWYLKYMTVGSGSTAANADDTELESEDTTSLKELLQAHGDELGNAFAGLGDTGLSYYTQIAWRVLYAAGEANGEIRELALWFADGATNPSGDHPTATPTRGRAASRKVLSGVIEKTGDFTLEFIWIYIY